MRIMLWSLLAIAIGFASWGWFRPYAWNPDPGAQGVIVGTEVKADRSYYWVSVHFKVVPQEGHDLMKPARLVTSSGKEIEPDTTLAGDAEKSIKEIWFRFWLEPEDMKGPLKLKVNDGSLMVKSRGGLPKLGKSGQRYFTTSKWRS